MSQVFSTAALVEPLDEQQIDGLPVYEWEVARIGDAAPALVYEVTEESIAEYCEAVRNDNPLYLDRLTAANGPFSGIIAPPTYVFKCAPLRRNEAMHARGFASPEEKGMRATPYAKSEVLFSRPIRPGDEITSVVRLEEMYERRGSQFMTWRTRAVDAAGALVVEYTYTIIWRQAPTGSSGSAGSAASAGSASMAPPPPQSGAASAGESLPAIVKLESQVAIDRYAELTRLRQRVGNSLHSDADFAKRTIFGGTVNMGVATAAYCSEVLERAFGPAALLQPGARMEFKGIRPVRAGDEITISGRVTQRSPVAAQCELTVHNQQAALVGIGSATVMLSGS